MDNHSGKISYKVRKASPATPAEPTVSIFVAYGNRDETGDLLLASNLVEPEIDSYIADLKRSLDDIGRKAKKRLQEARRENFKNLKRSRTGQEDGT